MCCKYAMKMIVDAARIKVELLGDKYPATGLIWKPVFFFK